jgi:hypothetical protein
MDTVGFSTGYRVHVDSKRRPTLPAALLAEAKIDASHDLVAHADGLGRIVLEDPLAVLAVFQDDVLAGKAEQGNDTSLVADLLADRAADSSAAV